MNYHIRQAKVEDAHYLPLVEHRAAQIFRQFPETIWIAEAQSILPEKHLHYIINGCCWVAMNEHNKIIGFISLSMQDHNLHIDEISVDMAFQRQGVGKQLLAKCESFARAKCYNSITLITFSDIPWNKPWYIKQGYQLIKDYELTPELITFREYEVQHGLTQDIRCTMIKHLL